MRARAPGDTLSPMPGTTERSSRATRASRGSGAVVLVVSTLALVGCGSEDHGTGQPPPASVFGPSVRRVVVEVDYVPRAEPYTGGAGALGDVWDLTRKNLAALFAADGKEVVVPDLLSDMEPVTVPDGPYRGVDLAAIAAAHRDAHSSGQTVTFYAVWLDGFYATEQGVDETVLGAALPDYGVIGIFKPVIRRLERPFAPAVAPFTEQSALVHELGHALGLVNAGLPLGSPHEDTDHPGHCTAPTCVMYWSNEGGTALFRFASDLVQTGSSVLFDDACLGDAKAAFEREKRPGN